MTDDDKKELAELEQQTEQFKYGLMCSLASMGLAVPFFYMVLLETNPIYPIIAGILGWAAGHYYVKYVKQ